MKIQFVFGLNQFGKTRIGYQLLVTKFMSGELNVDDKFKAMVNVTIGHQHLEIVIGIVILSPTFSVIRLLTFI